jgi:small GTP-binding protein
VVSINKLNRFNAIHGIIFKVLIVGNDGVGLSTFLKNYTRETPSRESFLNPDIQSYLMNFSCNEKSYKIQLLKLSNEEKYKAMKNEYLKDANALIFFYDLTEPKSLRIVPELVDQLNENKVRIPTMLLGNKVDLISHRQMFEDDIAYMLEKFGISLSYDISAREGINVDNAFSDLLKRLVNDDSIECQPITSLKGTRPGYESLQRKGKKRSLDEKHTVFNIVVFGEPDFQNWSKLSRMFYSDTIISDSKMHLGVHFKIKYELIDGTSYKIQIWDFIGNKDAKRGVIVPTYVRGSLGGLFIYDVNDHSSLECFNDWLQLIKKGLREDNYFPIIVVGLISGEEENRKVSREEAVKVVEGSGVDGYLECNVDTGKNLEMMFEELIKLML